MTTFSKNISFAGVNESILDALKKSPEKRYVLLMILLFLLIGFGALMWVFQVKKGMGVTGLNHPVGWATYITNFVFWIGIAHSGTLISAILYLMRSQWRNAVSRATEAMTVIAVMTAGMFPLVHLGRVWVFYYLVPYPNQRWLYPNYMSPLVWDLIAVLTYFTVSLIFFYFGLIPDAAAARDRFANKYGPDHWRARFFKSISLGWSGSTSEWRHYDRSYLLFALLATPLVVSVHSIVSWDFASSLLPGWHSTIFAPYFVAGAIHSGLAMSLTLLIPLRKFFNLKELVTDKHLETIAKTMLVTTLIIAYTYLIEPSMEYYSGNKFSKAFTQWRAVGGYLSPIFFLANILNVFVPLSFAFKAVRRNISWLFAASILVNVGMWLERFYIVTGSTAHDFIPHNWGSYGISIVEASIMAGLVSFFLFMFLGFSKTLPVITIADFKDFLIKGTLPPEESCKTAPVQQSVQEPVFNKKMLIFSSPVKLVNAAKKICTEGFRIDEVFSPMKLTEVEKLLNRHKSPVGFWTLVGGIVGFVSGVWLTIGSVEIFNIVVGGKPAVSRTPYVPIMFELTILLATLFNLVAVIYCARLYRRRTRPYYDPRFSDNKFGILLSYDRYYDDKLRSLLNDIKPDEEHDRE